MSSSLRQTCSLCSINLHELQTLMIAGHWNIWWELFEPHIARSDDLVLNLFLTLRVKPTKNRSFSQFRFNISKL